MSAIVGIYYPNNRPTDKASLKRMAEALAYRGPDSASLWSEGSVGLGHNMFRTTPESQHERLPLADKTGRLVLTADARIDNREEIVAALGLSDRLIDEITDGELILAAYERWGELCPEKLLGDFAFTIWDARNQLLFSARDHFGTKPFYYYWRSNEIFAFASEAHALFHVPDIPRQLNESRVAGYLADIIENKTDTMYHNVLRLAPGHSLTVSRRGVSERAYWSLDGTQELRLRSDDEYAEAFREVFTEAVRCRLRSISPVGAFLSGGIDSSSVACVARDLLVGPLRTFSAIFEGSEEAGEHPFIEAVLQQEGFESDLVPVDRVSPLTYANRLVHHPDEPWDNPHASMGCALIGRAYERHVRVLLDGNGGDSTVSYNFVHMKELASRMRWLTLSREAAGLSRHFYLNRRSPRNVLWRFGFRPLVPHYVLRARSVLGKRRRPARGFRDLIRPDFAKRVDLAARLKAVKREEARAERSARDFHMFEVQHSMIAYGMEAGDRTTSAFPVELRSPFYDKRLVQFCVALPREQRIRQGWTRFIVRRGLAGTLPKRVLRRGSKWNPNSTFSRRLLMFERERLESVVSQGADVIEDYVDVSALRKEFEQYLTLGAQYSPYTIWPAVTLALWLSSTGVERA